MRYTFRVPVHCLFEECFITHFYYIFLSLLIFKLSVNFDTLMNDLLLGYLFRIERYLHVFSIDLLFAWWIYLDFFAFLCFPSFLSFSSLLLPSVAILQPFWMPLFFILFFPFVFVHFTLYFCSNYCT